jgi:hypothetical protein
VLKPIGRGGLLSLATFNLFARRAEIDEITHEIGTHPLSLPTLLVWRLTQTMAWMVLDYSDGSHRFYDHAMTTAAAQFPPRHGFGLF